MSQPKPPRRSQTATVIGSLLLVVLVYLAFQWLSGGTAQQTQAPADSTPAAEAPAESQDSPQPQAEAQESVAQPPPTATYAAKSDLPLIAYEDLPPEAHDTIALIDSDGPFPYDKDGSTFQNREGILPQEPRGYYREYTVETPGSPDRGARRIVGGDDGELYYTDDHYDSFSEVVR